MWVKSARVSCPNMEPEQGERDPRADFWALDREERWALIAEHLFPAETYMRRTFRPSSKAPLLWLYAVRIVTGAGKWIRAVRPL